VDRNFYGEFLIGKPWKPEAETAAIPVGEKRKRFKGKKSVVRDVLRVLRK